MHLVSLIVNGGHVDMWYHPMSCCTKIFCIDGDFSPDD